MNEKSETATSTLVHLPLAFVRSGWVNVSTTYVGGVRNVGEDGGGWSRTARSATNAYNLNTNPTYVNPSGNSRHWSGFPLRFPLHEALDWVEAAEGETVPSDKIN